MLGYQMVQYRYLQVEKVSSLSATGSKENFLGERKQDLDLERMTWNGEDRAENNAKSLKHKMSGCQPFLSEATKQKAAAPKPTKLYH